MVYTPRTWSSADTVSPQRPPRTTDQPASHIEHLLVHAIVILLMTLPLFATITYLTYDHLPPQDSDLIMTVMLSSVVMIVMTLTGLDILQTGLRLLIRHLRRR